MGVCSVDVGALDPNEKPKVAETVLELQAVNWVVLYAAIHVIAYPAPRWRIRCLSIRSSASN